MFKTNTLRKGQLWGSVAALVAASLLPVLLGSQAAHAAQITQRKITLGSSKVSTANTNSVSFRPATAASNILGIVVEFCMNSPLIGQSCTTTNGVTASPTTGTVSVTHNSQTVAFDVNAASVNTGRLILTHATGLTSVVTSSDLTFSFTATNPSTTGTYYARLLTYGSVAGAAAYTSATPGTHLDDGGVALSTANQLTVNARVQEQLQFCVGTLTSGGAAPVDCAAGFAGTTVDLGVVDSGAASVSPVAVASGGNNMNGAAMVRTNAANGVVIDYFAEQATSGTNHLGALRVAGASCNAGVVSTDQCFNSAGTTQTAFSAAGERFGMTVSAIDVTSSATPTNNLVRDGEYDGDGTAAQGFAWDESGSFDRIASSAGGAGPETRVVDDEMLLLRFAARSAVTTPTGQYSVTSTYVATATF